MPVYKKGDSWRVRIYIEGRPKDWIVRGSKRDAELWEARQRIEIGEGIRPVSLRAVPRLADACERYVQEVGPTMAAESLRVLNARLAPLIQSLGDRKLDALDVEVRRYQRMRLKEGRKPSTINDEIKRLRAVVNHYRGEGMPLPRLKTSLLPVPKGKRVKVWNAEEIGRLLAAAEQHAPRFLPVLILQAYTGCRPGESIRLRMESVDFDAGLLWIEPTGELIPAGEDWAPKDKEPRAVPIPDSLRPWLDRRKGQTFYAVKPGGKPWGIYSKYFWGKALAGAGLTGTPHMMRHTYASTWLRAGGDIYTLSKVLGHSDVRLTIDTYAHLIPGHLQASKDLVGYGTVPGAAAAEARERWAGNRAPGRAHGPGCKG
jgi:integrase